MAAHCEQSPSFLGLPKTSAVGFPHCGQRLSCVGRDTSINKFEIVFLIKNLVDSITKFIGFVNRRKGIFAGFEIMKNTAAAEGGGAWWLVVYDGVTVGQGGVGRRSVARNDAKNVKIAFLRQ